MTLLLASAAFWLSLQPAWGQPKPGDLLAYGPRKEKRIALTFDDGPGPHTEKFLELLDRYQAKATFFMLGDQVQKRSKIAKRVSEKGHEIGSHTMWHVSYRTRQPHEAKKELLDDLNESSKIIERSVGIRPTILRMPKGADRPWIRDAAKEAGLILVNWSYGADWSGEPVERLKESYKRAIHPGAILLLHDGWGRTDKSLILAEAVLQAAKEEGYEVVPVGTLIGLER
ncbi:MAG: polysaccharide deacetylase family protein [Elusimicrobia bacterium]|nr:polysaccharide deacetylase family protein [Elusimicrobiota bacterium]